MEFAVELFVMFLAFLSVVSLRINYCVVLWTILYLFDGAIRWCMVIITLGMLAVATIVMSWTLPCDLAALQAAFMIFISSPTPLTGEEYTYAHPTRIVGIRTWYTSLWFLLSTSSRCLVFIAYVSMYSYQMKEQHASSMIILALLPDALFLTVKSSIFSPLLTWGTLIFSLLSSSAFSNSKTDSSTVWANIQILYQYCHSYEYQNYHQLYRHSCEYQNYHQLDRHSYEYQNYLLTQHICWWTMDKLLKMADSKMGLKEFSYSAICCVNVIGPW